MENTQILIRVQPKDIDYINRIIEAYDGLGLVHTLDRKEGIVAIHVTPDTVADVWDILDNLVVEIEFLCTGNRE
jgi:Domain of unknown function (DUF4911)